jgi:hypothetical protein
MKSQHFAVLLGSIPGSNRFSMALLPFASGMLPLTLALAQKMLEFSG